MQCNSLGQIGSPFTPSASSGSRSEQAKGGEIKEGTYALTGMSYYNVPKVAIVILTSAKVTGTSLFTASTYDQVLSTSSGTAAPMVTRRSDIYVAEGTKLNTATICPAQAKPADLEYTATDTEIRIFAKDAQSGIQITYVLAKR